MLTEHQVCKAWIAVDTQFQKEEFLEQFLLNAGLFAGKHPDPSYSTFREFKTNTVFPIVDANVAALYAQNPRVSVTPRRRRFILEGKGGQRVVDGMRAGKLLEDVCDYITKTQNLKIQFQNCIRDTELAGYGVVELGWMSDIERLELPKEVVANGGVRNISIEYKEHLKKESTYTVRRDPRQFLFPPFALDLNQLPRVTFWEYVSADEVISEPNFDKKMRNEIAAKIRKNGGYSFTSPTTGNPLYGALDMRSVNRDPEFCQIKLYHVYCLKEKKYKVYADDCSDFLRNEEWESVFGKMEGYPFEFLSYHPSYHSLYPYKPVDFYKTKAIEKERMRVRMLDAIDKSVAKILTTERDIVERNRFATAPQGGVVEVKDLNSYREIIVSHMPPEWLTFYQMMEADIQVEAQSLETKIGGESQSTKATELIQREAAFQVKKQRKQDAVEVFLTRIYRKIVQLLQDNMTKEMSFRISDENGGYDFRSFTKDDIHGEYDFEIDIETAAPSTQARKIGLWRGVKEMFALDPFVDQRKVDLQIFNALKISADEVMTNPVNVDAIQVAEFEFRAMLKGVPTAPKEGEDHNAHIDAHLQQLLGLQQDQGQGIPQTPEVVQAAQLLIQHITATEEMLKPTGSLIPMREESTQGNRTMQSEKASASTPIGQALSATTEATRNEAGQ